MFATELATTTSYIKTTGKARTIAWPTLIYRARNAWAGGTRMLIGPWRSEKSTPGGQFLLEPLMLLPVCVGDISDLHGCFLLFDRKRIQFTRHGRPASQQAGALDYPLLCLVCFSEPFLDTFTQTPYTIHSQEVRFRIHPPHRSCMITITDGHTECQHAVRCK